MTNALAAPERARRLAASEDQAEIDALFAECVDPRVLADYRALDDGCAVLRRVSRGGLAAAFGDARDNFEVFCWLASDDATRAPELTSLAVAALPERHGAARVLGVLLGRGRFSTTNLSQDELQRIVDLLSAGDDATRAVSTLVVRAAAQQPGAVTAILERVRATRDYALLAALVPILPEALDLVWSMEPGPDPPLEFFDVLSSVANDTMLRERVRRQFSELLERADHVRAATVRAKLLASVNEQIGDVAGAAAALDKLSQRYEFASMDTLELLICSTALPSVRERVVRTSLIEQLKELVDLEPPARYAVVAIFSRLAASPPMLSAEEEAAVELQRRAAGKSVYDFQREQRSKEQLRASSREAVDLILRCSFLTAISRTSLTNSVCEQLAQLLRELASPSQYTVRETVAQQRGAMLALYIYQRLGPENPAHRVAASAFARVLSAVPASEALIGGPSTPIDYIEPLLGLVTDERGTPQVIDKYEALRALTNVSPARAQQVYLRIGARLLDMMSSTAILLRRSSAELICNLSAEPTVAQHWGTAEIRALAACLLVVGDRPTRLAGGGGLAMFSATTSGAEKIGSDEICRENLLACIKAHFHDVELMLRALTCVEALVHTDAVVSLRNAGFRDAVALVQSHQLGALVGSITDVLQDTA